MTPSPEPETAPVTPAPGAEPGDEETPALRRLYGYRTFITALAGMILATAALHSGRIDGGDWQTVILGAFGLYGLRRWRKGADE